jgi:hypothetical protein
MWKLEFSCVECQKTFTFSVEAPRSVTVSNDRAIRTFIPEFVLPPEAQFFTSDSDRCYECGRARWNAGYAAQLTKRAEDFEALVAEYAILARTDRVGLAKKLAATDHFNWHGHDHLRAVAAALERAD